MKNEFDEKIIKILSLLGFTVSSSSYSSYIATSSNYQKITIRKNYGNKNLYAVTAYLPDIEKEYYHLDDNSPITYRSGNFSIESRSIDSLVKDIRNRILKGYIQAINERLEKIWKMKKEYKKNEDESFYLNLYLGSLGYKFGYKKREIYKKQTMIKRNYNYTYNLSVKNLNREQLSEVIALIEKLEVN